MLTFACKRIEMADIVRCSFGLTGTEYAVLAALIRRGCARASGVGRLLGLERTGVQKALTSLAEKGLVSRTKLNLAGGGFAFVYRAENLSRIRKRMKESVRAWARAVEERVDSTFR